VLALDPLAFCAQILKLLAGLLRGILRFLVCELGRLVRFERKLHGLLGVFVPGQVNLLFRDAPRQRDVRGQPVREIQRRVDANRLA